MKKRNLLFISLLLITFIANAQIKKRKGTIVFKDGTEKTGFIRQSGKNMRFATEKRGKETKFNNDLVKEIKIKRDGKYKTFYFKTEVGKNKSILLERVLEGKTNLYLITTLEGYYNPSSFGLMSGGMQIKENHYYLEDKNSDNVIRFKQKFNQKAKEYFKDCDKLVKLIGTKDYRRKDIFDIVEYYNEECE